MCLCEQEVKLIFYKMAEEQETGLFGLKIRPVQTQEELDALLGQNSECTGSGLENVLVFAEKNKLFVIDKDDSVKKVASRDNWILALCSNNGKLYDAGDYKKVFETLAGKEVASRNNRIWALCSHKKKLYDAGCYNKVFETLAGKEVASRNNSILALCSHPRKAFVDAGILK